ncbi:hypothetical protein D1007_15014 [Hordeum vulgare]|nr:hypothetical protein D1007_15014 [Hordeum vulgare]
MRCTRRLCKAMETKLAHASSPSHRRHVHQATGPLFHHCRGPASTSRPGRVTTVSRMCCCRAPLRLAASTEPRGCSSASAAGRRRPPPRSSYRRDFRLCRGSALTSLSSRATTVTRLCCCRARRLAIAHQPRTPRLPQP